MGGGGGGWGEGYGDGGKGKTLYQSLHCHHQNASCIKMGSDESHFHVSLIVRDKVTRQCPQTTTLEEKGEQKRIRTKVLLLNHPNALPLGQTVSQHRFQCCPFQIHYAIFRTDEPHLSANERLPFGMNRICQPMSAFRLGARPLCKWRRNLNC